MSDLSLTQMTFSLVTVTRVCLTNAILTAKASTDAAVAPRPWHSYLPVASTLPPKHPQYVVHVDHAIGNDLEQPVFPGDSRPERSRGLQSASSSSNHQQQSRTNILQRFPTEIHHDEVRLTAEVPSNASPSLSPPMRATTTTAKTTTKTTTTTALSRPRGIREYQRDVPRRFSYQDIEELDGYLTDDLDDGKLPYRGKAESTYQRRRPQDITTAIKALDRFLNEALNADSYNSQLHLPPNPVLALVLSRYGRYVPGTRNPRVYANTAVNNMHNNKPFGIYKYECDEQPIYAVR
ncbi:PREDICTED: uncharacterized protein LOC106744163 [Dinoponera quadriceps]|uniref:Uncharacterized protein LOC106744163 n=1 Tax=Dinoponera quadriceps TaxID=609295 RepID=A0A6P3X8E7_DINQU|nr:PREDICTED: uncharacterized protein LOC106744163 [Dinoponera quadriceps]